jgi:uncharacterized protein (DUF2252 family)
MNRNPIKDHSTVAERVDWGRNLRSEVPRRSHAVWEAPADRPDPVGVLEAQNPSRLQMLVPIRHQRMLVSPFTFYRGSAAVMAGDLAAGASTGLTAQICGDAHLANFGVFGSPERALVFDLNDFDETHPGPWEWDVKRLAVSGTLMARDRGWDPEVQRELARIAAAAYHYSLAEFANMGRQEVWYSRMTDEEILALVKDAKAYRSTRRVLDKARHNDVHRAVAKYTEVVDGRRRFVHQPPLVSRLSEVFSGDEVARLENDVYELFAQYLETIPDFMLMLVEGYELIDIALKVVGVGSVGTRCLIALARGRDDDDLAILQIKEAGVSAIAPFVDPVPWKNQGQRVVVGQHLMQAASDQFLGWSRARDVDYYLRQFRDMKGSAVLARMTPGNTKAYLVLCGWTLARAHARSGDRIAIDAYLGTSDRFSQAVADWSMAYADQVDADYQLFLAAAASGRIPVAEGPPV